MNRKLIATVGLAVCLGSAGAHASNWVQVGPQREVDAASVRRETFPAPALPGAGYAPIFPNGKKETYLVAWLRSSEPGGLSWEEDVFDCNGHVGMLQRIVQNDTKDSPYHSGNQSQMAHEAGVSFIDIPPDSDLDYAQKIICKDMPHLSVTPSDELHLPPPDGTPRQTQMDGSYLAVPTQPTTLNDNLHYFGLR